MPLSEAHLAAKSMSKFATCQEVDTPEYPCLYVAFLFSVVQYPEIFRHEKRKRDSQWHLATLLLFGRRLDVLRRRMVLSNGQPPAT
jgi:hypothetical protein